MGEWTDLVDLLQPELITGPLKSASGGGHLGDLAPENRLKASSRRHSAQVLVGRPGSPDNFAFTRVWIF